MDRQPYQWPLHSEFRNRSAELARMEVWWEDGLRQPLAILGRRRVGKSWLFRRFAHDRDALILVAEQLPAHSQLTRFAADLEPYLGVRPHLPDAATLFRTLFRLGRDRRLLVIIDEFPWLLSPTSTAARGELTAIQAAIEEERDGSQIKLILCGSHIGQMESLFSESNPMHGRLQRLHVRPLPVAHATGMLVGLTPFDMFERFAISGGMPMYLQRLAAGSLREAVVRSTLTPDSALWHEGRAIVEQELREPRVYFAILEQLAAGSKTLNEIAQPLATTTNAVGKYLSTLHELHIVSRKDPFGAASSSRSGHWQLDDSFLRFWFRFVFPFRADLEAGLSPVQLFDNEIRPAIADHVAPVFEAWFLEWLRMNRSGIATTWGNWWGNAANEFRRTKQRSSEEIDAVGALRGRVTVIAEAKWTSQPLAASIISDIDTYKIPALRQSGLKVVARPRIILASKGGYSAGLVELSATSDRIELIDVAAELVRQQRHEM